MTPSLAPGPDFTELPPGQIHVWLAEPDLYSPAALVARHAHLLSAAERARHQAFRFERDRHTYMSAHALARRVLAGLTGIAPEQLEFVKSAGGKPHPVLPPPFATIGYSLSHTSGMVACALGRDMDCGVDVELRRPLDDMMALAAGIFTPAEIAQLEACAPEARETCFFRLWTLKEAYAKATGDGIVGDLSHVSLTAVEGSASAVFSAGHDASGWHFHSTEAGPRHLLGVAARAPGSAAVSVTRHRAML